MEQARRCVVLLALFLCASAEDEQLVENDCAVLNSTCETHTLSTILGHTVLLPCNFSQNHQSVVSWMHSGETSVVNVTSDGRVNFFDPRFGRVNAFPNQGCRGNYSISIDNVNSTDLGCYQCVMGNKCVQVELALKTELDSDNSWFPFYIDIVSGAAAVILLTIGGYFCLKKLMWVSRETEEINVIILDEVADGVCHPIEESGREPGDGQRQSNHPQAAATYENQIVYENEDNDEPDYLNELPQCSYMNQCEVSHRGQFNFVRVSSQRTKQRFHTELFNRLRQASVRKHHYVNQDEIRKQQDTLASKGAEKGKAKTCPQFPNPIYNRSTDNINKM